MSKRKKQIIYFIAGLVFAAYVIYNLFQARANGWKKYIPAKLNVSFVSASSSNDPHYCEVAVYSLSEIDAEAIKKEGLKFFNDAIYPRESDRPRFYEWSITPVPEYWFSEGANSYPFYCAENPGILTGALKSAGSYIGASYNNRTLIVIPGVKILMYIYVER